MSKPKNVWWNRHAFVYLAFDEADRLIYVGCTTRLRERTYAHRNDSDWFRFATRFRLLGPFTHDTGRNLEADLIEDESPWFNSKAKAGAKCPLGRHGRLAAYLQERLASRAGRAA